MVFSLRAGLLRANSLQTLVVDEVDACLAEEATRALLGEILSSADVSKSVRKATEPRQTVFVSATLPQVSFAHAQRHPFATTVPIAIL